MSTSNMKSSTKPTQQFCRFFNREGGCKNGDQCEFIHQELKKNTSACIDCNKVSHRLEHHTRCKTCQDVFKAKIGHVEHVPRIRDYADKKCESCDAMIAHQLHRCADCHVKYKASSVVSAPCIGYECKNKAYNGYEYCTPCYQDYQNERYQEAFQKKTQLASKISSLPFVKCFTSGCKETTQFFQGDEVNEPLGKKFCKTCRDLYNDYVVTKSCNTCGKKHPRGTRCVC